MNFLEQFFGFMNLQFWSLPKKYQSTIQFETTLNSIYNAINEKFKNIYNISFD
jgi:hypothetical protein